MLEQEKKVMYDYYVLDGECARRTDQLREKVYAILNRWNEEHPGSNGYEKKRMQYRVISQEVEPVLFRGIPFYCELGSLDPYSDGLWSRSSNPSHHAANGWAVGQNAHLIADAMPDEINRQYAAAVREKLFLGYPYRYFDEEHFSMPLEKIFAKGMKGIYEEALAALDKSENEEERDFALAAIESLMAYRRMMNKFSMAAVEKARKETDPDERRMLLKMAKTAANVPWNKPQSVYEGLCTYAFLRKAFGSIEGIGMNSFDRPDVELLPLYEADIRRGVSRDEIYVLICKFILLWDCHVDRRKTMSGYADYEYENSLTLGGCDAEGNEVFNDITSLFLQAHMELDAMYPKIKCRYSSKSSPAYIAAITAPILKQQSTLLYCNDDATIPSLMRFGFSQSDAYDYNVSGCWGISANDRYKRQVGYLNCLRALEWAICPPYEKLEEIGIRDAFKAFDEADDFETLYEKTMSNILLFVNIKAGAEAQALHKWHEAVPMCAYSALLSDALAKRKDFTNGGGRYNWEAFNPAALPDMVDSLLSIRRLVFQDKLCTLAEVLRQCRENWPNEQLRCEAMKTPGYGDGSEEPARLMGRVLNDLYTKTRSLPTTLGGQWQIAVYMYTEIIWWGQAMNATPNGRRNGDYLSQGLTPSRFHEIRSVTDVFSSLRYIDMTQLAGGGIINVVLPHAMVTPQVLDGFMRGCAKSMMHQLQLNCVNKDDLFKAQKDPEHYGHIIVRVCGFSAPFVKLSEDFQKEFLSRNYYAE